MKWRNIQSLDDGRPSWMDPAQWRVVRDVSAEVRRRMGTTAWIDIARKELLFGYDREGGDPSIQHSIRLMRRASAGIPWRADPVLGDQNADDICTAIYWTRVPKKIKDRWARQHAQRRQWEREEARDAQAHEYGRTVADRARVTDRTSILTS